MSRLVVVSNRVAVPDDQPSNAGGLSMALRDALQEKGGVWFGWSGQTAERTSEQPTITQVGEITYATLDLSQEDHDHYYNGYANRTLWPLFHYRIDLADHCRQDYAGYRRVNESFADRLCPMITDDDDLWVHDYHLIPLGNELRSRGVKNRIGFFLHTPFPALEVYLTLPAHETLARSLCAYDLVGFQTVNDMRAFVDYAVHEGGGEMIAPNRLRAYGATVRLEVVPISVESEMLGRLASHGMQSTDARNLAQSMGDRTFMIGVDRLDYSKGIPERFRSHERFLERYPQHHGQVVLLQIAPPSRSEVQEYQDICDTLQGECGRINGQYADIGWSPIHFMNRGLPRDTLMSFYRMCGVGVVTPLRDGMNLVAKEYVASQNPHEPGVLVLSRFAGAARELDAALLVNPYDRDAVADALHRALIMPLGERTERWESMMQKIRDNSIDTWRETFLAALRDEAPSP
jgi:trehalose 6-phosphate synthase